jgi:hypothetical protein
MSDWLDCDHQERKRLHPKIENGERRMDLIEMIAIADALDVQPSEILRRLEAQITRPVQL